MAKIAAEHLKASEGQKCGVVHVHRARDHRPSPTIKCLYLSGVVGTLECASILKRRFECTPLREASAVKGTLGYESETPTVKVVDTTSDTTQSATRRNVGQPRANKSAYLSLFCNI